MNNFYEQMLFKSMKVEVFSKQEIKDAFKKVLRVGYQMSKKFKNKNKTQVFNDRTYSMKSRLLILLHA